MPPISYTLQELAARVGGEVAGDGSVRLRRVAPVEEAGPDEITFFSNKKYRAAYQASRAAAVIVDLEEPVAAGRNLLRVKNAYLAFAKVSTLFHPPAQAVPDVAPEAFVHPSARVAPSAEIQPLAYVGPGAEVGARTVLFPGACVGAEARVGEDCILYPNVVVRERCRVGNRVILQPGCVVGSDGYGFAFDVEGEGGSGPRHYKLPQAGAVVIEDDVELGANTCVDRGTLGDTVVGRGAKVDNLVQIAHNVAVGPLSLIMSQVGISGSTKLGVGVIVAGQAGIVGHLHIGDGAKIAAQSGVMEDLPPGEVHGGSPSRHHGEWMRQHAALLRLPELLKAVRRLEKEIALLKGKP
jgi:UDP-3-O-[3-hydroxymyristoyl] glucosamine N-acyltransferase